MSLLDKYIQRCEVMPEGGNPEPYLFAFTANFRNILKFEDGFETYSELCEMTDAQLADYVAQSPLQIKSFMTNMRRTNLFAAYGDKIIRTAKGEVYEKFLHERLGRDDRWFLNYMFIVDSYFELEKNYIFSCTARIFDKLVKAGYSIGQIYNSLIYLFNIREGNKEEYLRSEYLIMLSFINDPEFLEAYRTADEFSRGELHDFIVDNFAKQRFSCPVSALLSPQSLTDCDTILDDAKLLFFSHYLMSSRPISLEDFIEVFAQVYTRFYKLNNRKTSNFIMMNEDVFRMTHLNLFADLKAFHTLESSESDYKTEEELFEGYIDYTTTENLPRLAKIAALLSRKAKEDSGNKCVLDSDCGCKYFKSKDGKENYLEVHQLIPREYAGEFNVSLETPDNYVALCPHCHSLIHNASDEERLKALSKIYARRKDGLDKAGIIPTEEILYAVCGVEQSLIGGVDISTLRLNRPQPKLPAGKGKAKKTISKKR